MTHPVIFRKNLLTFRTSTVTLWINYFIFTTNLVIFRADLVMFKKNQCLFRTNLVIFMTYQSVLGQIQS